MPKKAVVVKAAKRKPAVKRAVVKIAPARSLKAPAPRMKAARNNSAKQYGFRSSSAGSAIGTALGTAIGGPGGGMIGNALGGIGGTILSKIFGGGDYAVSNAPALKENSIALANSAQAPQFGTGRVAVNFKHREFLGDVISSHTANTFNIQAFSVNPGISQTFPWLSGVVGTKFQQYRLNGCTFEFRSMSGDALNSVNTALGQVIMASDYDSADSAFTTKQQMENTEYGVSGKPSCNMMHGIECARSQTSVSELYVRAFAVPAGADIRLYDMCKFYIASNGCQGTDVNLGELWVSYDIDAFKAIEQPPGYGIESAQYENDTKVSMNTTTWGVAANRFAQSVDKIGLTFNNLTKMFFPSTVQIGANYLVTIYMQGDSTAVTGGAITCGQGLTLVGAQIAPSAGSTTTQWSATLLVTVAGPIVPSALPYIDIAAGGTFPANVTFSDIQVSKVGSSMVAL